MVIEDLFEKRERGLWVLLSTLINHSTDLEIKEAMAQTALSKVTLLKYVEDLNDLADSQDFPLSIQLINDRLGLNLGPHVTKQDIVQLFLPYSLKYQILDYLFKVEEYTVQKLSQELLISEATFHRQLVSLNVLLEEFYLAVRSGRIRGPEHQIRYFYFRLYTLVEPKKRLSKLAQSKESQQVIRSFQQLWGQDTFADREAEIGLWLMITRQRMGVKYKDFNALKELMKPYYSHRFYQQVRQNTLVFLSRYALESEEEEAMCQFMFMTTMSILPAFVMERSLGYGGPVSEATTTGLQYIRSTVSSQENLNEQGMYSLNQILGRLYFFKGAIIERSIDYELDRSLIKHGMNLENEDLAIPLLEDVITNIYHYDHKELGDAYKEAEWTLTEVLSYVVYQMPMTISIGLDLIGDETEKLPILSVMRQRLEVNRLVSVEIYDKRKYFNLIVSNAYDRDYPIPYYYLKGLPNHFDMRQLEIIIQRLFNSEN